jgi:hypothetical protein
MKSEAYWVSPYSDIIPVQDQRHIHDIINNAEKFGITKDYIESIYKKHKEPLYHEGWAREEILVKLIKDGWIRIRFLPKFDSFTIQINKLNKSAQESIWDFAVGVTGKFDKISKFTGVKILNLNGDVLIDGNLNDIIRYTAFQGMEEKFKYKNTFMLLEDYLGE